MSFEFIKEPHLPIVIDEGPVNIALGQVAQWGIAKLGVQQFWDKGFKGQGVTVWIVDTQLTEHIDLPRPSINPFIASQGAAQHGTHVAGIVSAKDNDIGVIGTAPEIAALRGVTVLSDAGSGPWDVLANGLNHIFVQIRAMPAATRHVINLSLGAELRPNQYPSRIVQAIENLHTLPNVFLVAAAGNAGNNGTDNQSFPSILPQFLAVGSIEENGQVSYFSSKGPKVDVMAPGGKIISSVGKDQYRVFSGTSMAAPFVSGLAALVWSAKPSLTNIQLHKLFKDTATDMLTPGFDPISGHGVVNPSALFKAVTGTPTTPDVPTDDTKDKEIAALRKEIADLKLHLEGSTNKVVQQGKEIDMLKHQLNIFRVEIIETVETLQKLI